MKKISVKGGYAQYAIEDNGSSFNVRIGFAYTVGSMMGAQFPGKDFDSRDECLEHFVMMALRHFDVSRLSHEESKDDSMIRVSKEMSRKLRIFKNRGYK